MVNKILIFFAYVLFFILALMYFTPKTSLYFMLEKELKKQDLIISNEKVYDNGFSLSLEDATLYVKGIDSAVIKETDVKLFVLYNTININDVTLTDVAGSFIPLEIENINITYSVLNPLNISIDAKGGFGEVSGGVSIVDKKLHLNLIPSEVMKKKHKTTMRQLKKQEDGSYSYDKNF